MDYFEIFRPVHRVWGHFTWKERLASMVVHASVPLGLIFVPEVGGLVGPLLIALTIGEVSRSVEEESLEAFNFGVTMTLLVFLGEVLVRLDSAFQWHSSVEVIAQAAVVGISAVSAYRAIKRIGLHERRYPHGLHLVRSNASWVPKHEMPPRQKRDWRPVIRRMRTRSEPSNIT